MTKREFIAKFRRLNDRQKKELMQYYVETYNGALFVETLAEAEKRIIWMRESLADHSA